MAYKNVNESARDEHAVIGGIAGKKVFIIDNAGNQITSFGGNATLNASPNFIGIVTVANPGAAAAGNVTLDPGSKTQIVGNVTLSDPKGFIGLVTVVGSLSPAAGNVTLDPGSQTGIIGNVTLSDSKGYIGLVTATVGNTVTVGAHALTAGVANIGFATVSVSNPTLYAVVNTTAASGLATVDIRNTVNAAVLGNVTLSDSKGYIGLVTATVGNTLTVNAHALTAGAAYVGLMTVDIGTNKTVTLGAGVAGVGFVTIAGNVGVTGNVTLSDSKGYVGLVTATVGNTLTVNAHALTAGAAYVGLVTVDIGTNKTVTLGAGVAGVGFATVNVAGTPNVALLGNVTLSDSKGFIGLVTANAVTKNAGTTKTLIPITFALSTTSLSTVVVPAGTFYITSLVASANATVGASIKSGVTYLVGNASVRMAVVPGGGWVDNGSVDAPTYIGLASGAAIVIEKNDITTNLAGKIIYYNE